LPCCACSYWAGHESFPSLRPCPFSCRARDTRNAIFVITFLFVLPFRGSTKRVGLFVLPRKGRTKRKLMTKIGFLVKTDALLTHFPFFFSPQNLWASSISEAFQHSGFGYGGGVGLGRFQNLWTFLGGSGFITNFGNGAAEISNSKRTSPGHG
jgi:hypothetical protein